MELIVFLCLAITAVGSHYNCPPPVIDSPDDDKFESEVTCFSENDYAKCENSYQVKKAEKALAKKIGLGVVNTLKASGSCAISKKPPTLNNHPLFNIQWYNYYWHKNCEPCPPNAQYLWKFNRNHCWVIYPRWQQVRFARCSYNKCGSPCGCGNTKCSPTEWTRVWFWAWCDRGCSGWRAGLNFHYLYLPQDCTCHQQIFHPNTDLYKAYNGLNKVD